MKKKVAKFCLGYGDRVHFLNNQVVEIKGYSREGAWVVAFEDGSEKTYRNMEEILNTVYHSKEKFEVVFALGMERAEKIRKLTGLSRADFCRRFGVPIRTMESWERNEGKPPNYVLNFLEEVVKRVDIQGDVELSYMDKGGKFIGFC